jgi:Sec-independent protein secretion pathway component TatC
MSKTRYFSEDLIANKHLFLTRDHNYNNDLPYFEISISTMANTNKMVFCIFITYISIVGLPFIIYQISLFFIPMMYRHEVSWYKKKIAYSLITTYVILILVMKYSLPIALKSITLTTEEISNYEFEVEFDIGTYINIYLSTISTHMIPIIFIASNNWMKLNWAIISLLFACIISSNYLSVVICSTIIYSTVFIIIEINRYIQLVTALIRYRYHITLNR